MKKGPNIGEITVECCHTKIHTVKWIKWPSLRHSEQVLDLKQKFKTIFSYNFFYIIAKTKKKLKNMKKTVRRVQKMVKVVKYSV